jgi:hypothetical protein
MRLADVNVLVYAFREDAPGHPAYRVWVQDLLASDEAFAVSSCVAGFSASSPPRVTRPRRRGARVAGVPNATRRTHRPGPRTGIFTRRVAKPCRGNHTGRLAGPWPSVGLMHYGPRYARFASLR